jgi:hypothetical protein
MLATLGVGWLGWSLVEWRHGRTPSYRLRNLRVVRRSDGGTVGFWRSAVRELCCLVLLLPTMAACCLVALAFVMGASPPDDLLRKPHLAPWDLLSGTEVVGEGLRHSGLRLGPNWPAGPTPGMS